MPQRPQYTYVPSTNNRDHHSMSSKGVEVCVWMFVIKYIHCFYYICVYMCVCVCVWLSIVSRWQVAHFAIINLLGDWTWDKKLSLSYSIYMNKYKYIDSILKVNVFVSLLKCFDVLVFTTLSLYTNCYR